MRGRGLFRLGGAMLLAGVLTFGAGAASAGQGRSHAKPTACTWGASSVVAYRVHGKYLQTKPVTTGCIPG